MDVCQKKDLWRLAKSFDGPLTIPVLSPPNPLDYSGSNGFPMSSLLSFIVCPGLVLVVGLGDSMISKIRGREHVASDLRLAPDKFLLVKTLHKYQ